MPLPKSKKLRAAWNKSLRENARRRRAAEDERIEAELRAKYQGEAVAPRSSLASLITGFFK